MSDCNSESELKVSDKVIISEENIKRICEQYGYEYEQENDGTHWFLNKYGEVSDESLDEILVLIGLDPEEDETEELFNLVNVTTLLEQRGNLM